LVIGTISLLGFMITGQQLTGDSFLSELWSSAIEYQAIRVGLIALLFGLLLSAPPRSMRFRMVLSVVSVALLCGSAVILLGYQMKMLDAVVFIELAIIFAIEALESPAHLRLSDQKGTAKLQA
jgi:peptidoglycan/LPS O-acetylase OafA/YrhL